MRLWRLRRRKRKPELEDLVTLISAIDGFRVGRCAELKSVEKIVRRVHLTDTGKKWKSIKRDLEAIMNLPTSSSKVMLMMNLALLLRFLGVLSYTIVFILALMTGLSPSLKMEPSTFTNIFTYVLIFGIGVLVVRYFVKEQVKKFFDQSANKFRGKSLHLRELNQELMTRLREGIKRSKANSRDYKLSLFNTDYNGIKVLKKPGVWREHFEAIPTE